MGFKSPKRSWRVDGGDYILKLELNQLVWKRIWFKCKGPISAREQRQGESWTRYLLLTKVTIWLRGFFLHPVKSKVHVNELPLIQGSKLLANRFSMTSFDGKEL